MPLRRRRQRVLGLPTSGEREADGRGAAQRRRADGRAVGPAGLAPVGRAMKALAVGVVLMLVASVASAQDSVPAMSQAFRVSLDGEQHPVAGRIVGQVHNDSGVRVTDVRLEILGFDTNRHAVGSRLAWAFGDIVPGGDTAFAFEPMPDASSYEIRGISYDVVSCPSGMS